jgi:tetratricopeptide (TPR) repeat protein
MQSVQGDHTGAARQHREIVEQRTRQYGPRHPLVAFSMTQLANELIAAEQAQAAETLLQQALAIQTEANVPVERVAQTLRVYGDLRARINRHALALADYREALRLLRAALGPEHAEVAQLHARIAALHETLGERAAAEREYREALRIAEGALGADHARTARIRESLAALQARSGPRTPLPAPAPPN